MIISNALQNVKRLAIETAPFIYYVENHANYADKNDLGLKRVTELRVLILDELQPTLPAN